MVNCMALEAYAELGLGQTASARQLFLEIAELEPSNADVRQEISRWKNSKTTRDPTRA